MHSCDKSSGTVSLRSFWWMGLLASAAVACSNSDETPSGSGGGSAASSSSSSSSTTSGGGGAGSTTGAGGAGGSETGSGGAGGVGGETGAGGAGGSETGTGGEGGGAGGAGGGDSTEPLFDEQATNDATNAYYQFSYTGIWSWYRAYLDTDNDPATGFDVGGVVGADYLLEGSSLFQHTGTGWSWNLIATVEFSDDSTAVGWTVPRAAIGETDNPNSATIAFQVEYGGGTIVTSPSFVHTYTP